MPHEPTQRRAAVADALIASAIVAVVREKDETRARKIAEGLIENGIRALEVTVATPGCFAILRDFNARGISRSVVLGAGTARSTDDVARAADAGATFIVSPHTDVEIIRAAARHGCVSIPGALTPTEILTAHGAGAEFVKVFPVSAVGGARYIRWVRGPIPDVRLWVSGNVSIEEIGELIEAGAQLVGLTSALSGDLGDDAAAMNAMMRDRIARAHEAVEVARVGRWLLYVRGPMSLVKVGLKELRAAPAEDHVLLESFVPGRRGQAVRLRRFLEGAGVPREAEVELSSEDGSFRRTVPAGALADGGLVHFATDGLPLERSAGGPLRLYIVGGDAGCDNVKALSQITVVSR